MKRYALTLALTLGLSTLALALGHSESISHAQAWLGVLTIVLGGIPAVVYLVEQRLDTVPLLPFHGLFYSATFGLPVFSEYLDTSDASESSITYALLITCAGLLALYMGYYFMASRLRIIQPLYVKIIRSEELVVKAGFIFLWCSIVVYLVPLLKDQSTLFNLAILLGTLGTCFLIGALIDHALSFWQSILALITIGALFAIKIASGALAPALYMLLLIGLIYWQKRKKIPWVPIVFVALAFATLNPIKMEFRYLTWAVTDLSVSEKLEVFNKLAVENYESAWLERSMFEGTNVNRIGHIVTFGRVIEQTPSIVPYWKGETLIPLLTKPIPRLLWPDKPEETLANTFWKSYGFLVGDDETSYNLPWLPELYANFGEIGVVTGMVLIGILFRFLVEKFRIDDRNDYRFYFGLVLFFNLFFAESNISSMFGGLLPVFFVMFIAFKVLQMIDMRGAVSDATCDARGVIK